jgi:hypothetical protein
MRKMLAKYLKTGHKHFLPRSGGITFGTMDILFSNNITTLDFKVL